jgi:hypothetical protein
MILYTVIGMDLQLVVEKNFDCILMKVLWLDIIHNATLLKMSYFQKKAIFKLKS